MINLGITFAGGTNSLEEQEHRYGSFRNRSRVIRAPWRRNVDLGEMAKRNVWSLYSISFHEAQEHWMRKNVGGARTLAALIGKANRTPPPE